MPIGSLPLCGTLIIHFFQNTLFGYPLSNFSLFPLPLCFKLYSNEQSTFRLTILNVDFAYDKVRYEIFCVLFVSFSLISCNCIYFAVRGSTESFLRLNSIPLWVSSQIQLHFLFIHPLLKIYFDSVKYF